MAADPRKRPLSRLSERARARLAGVEDDGWFFAKIAEQVAERLAQFESAGVDLVLLQFSPQLEEMERFAESVIRRNSPLSAPA